MQWLKRYIFCQQMQNRLIHYLGGIFYPKLDILFDDHLSVAVHNYGYHTQNMALCLCLVLDVWVRLLLTSMITGNCEFCSFNDDWSCKAASNATACLMMSSSILRWLASAWISVWSDSLLIPIISWYLRWMPWRL